MDASSMILFKDVLYMNLSCNLSMGQMITRSIKIMDNASIHHVDRVVTTIQQTGALVRFLPPYTPDYNPIEELFFKIKAYLKTNKLANDVISSPS